MFYISTLCETTDPGEQLHIHTGCYIKCYKNTIKWTTLQLYESVKTVYREKKLRIRCSSGK